MDNSYTIEKLDRPTGRSMSEFSAEQTDSNYAKLYMPRVDYVPPVSDPASVPVTAPEPLFPTLDEAAMKLCARAAALADYQATLAEKIVFRRKVFGADGRALMTVLTHAIALNMNHAWSISDQGVSHA